MNIAAENPAGAGVPTRPGACTPSSFGPDARHKEEAMKKPVKKLVLRKETVRSLDTRHLGVVAGGAKPATRSGCVTECAPTARTCDTGTTAVC